MTQTTLLLIEDEPQVRRFLRATLQAHDYRLLEAETGEEGLRQAAAHTPDLVLLDLGLPDLDGLEITRRLREWTTVPIVVLSARGQENDKVEALDAGADDYLTKPFGTGELLARIRVALRHRAAAATPDGDVVFVAGDLRVDFAARQVFVRGAEVHFTPTEYKLLALLIKHAGRVVTQRQILREVWGPNAQSQTHYLRVYMAQLRNKIEATPARPRQLVTEPGVGYRFRLELG